jgi:hypothetical protein
VYIGPQGRENILVILWAKKKTLLGARASSPAPVPMFGALDNPMSGQDARAPSGNRNHAFGMKYTAAAVYPPKTAILRVWHPLG